MNPPYPHFRVNLKVYPDMSGEDAFVSAWLLETIETETDVHFVLASQLPDIRLMTEHTNLTVAAPATDAIEPGRGVGKVLPGTVTGVGTDGAVINHTESRDTLPDPVWKIERCHDPNLDSAVCVDGIEMDRTVVGFDPDSMIYEVPEDISSDRAIAQAHPDRVRDFMSMVERKNPRTHVLVGGGISTTGDVHLAFKQEGRTTGAVSVMPLASESEPLPRDIAMSFP